MINKKDFLKAIKEHCPDIKGIEIDGYNRLFEGREKINFDKLYEHFLENWSYKNAPQAAFFARLLPPKKEGETCGTPAIEHAISSGFANIVGIDPKTTEHLVEFKDGNCVSFYNNIVEAPFDPTKCTPPPKEFLEALERLRDV